MVFGVYPKYDIASVLYTFIQNDSFHHYITYIDVNYD